MGTLQEGQALTCRHTPKACANLLGFKFVENNNNYQITGPYVHFTWIISTTVYKHSGRETESQSL